MSFGSRLMHAFNAFTKDMRLGPSRIDSEPSYNDRPRANGRRAMIERTTLSSIYNRIAIDASTVDIRHVRLDNDDRYLDDIRSNLDYCLRYSANIDQSGRALRQDVYMSLCEEGVVAVPGVKMTLDPETSGSFDVGELRVGTIVEWKPSRVKVKCWDGDKGEYAEIWQGKRYTPIVQNPLKAVMNEPNSTVQRLMTKLALLDTSDELVASGKLDLIIQLPYTVKSDTRRQGANQRRQDIETQLKGSKYGVAWTDATEKITQLNRPAENNLLTQVEWLTKKLYAELGITEEVMNGTADEATMINYYNRTIEPLVTAFVDELRRKFLTKTAITQGQSIMSFRDAFRNVPLAQVGEILDKLSRNEIITANEGRQAIGLKPSKDPKADTLVNSNMPTSDTGVQIPGQTPPEGGDPTAEADQMSADFESEINSLMQSDMPREDRFVENYLSHVYDPVKAHEYYMRVRKLKGKAKAAGKDPSKVDLPKKDVQTGPTNRHRVNATAANAAQDVGPQRAAAIQKLADRAKRELDKITQDFRDWVDKHPRATTREKETERRKAVDRKNQVVKKLKADVAKITRAASQNSTPKPATEGRRPAN